MNVYLVVLAGAALIGLASRRPDRRPPLRVRGLWLVFVAAALEVVPLATPLKQLSFGDALVRIGTTSGFVVLLALAWTNRRGAGVAVVMIGISLNLAVIAANGGQMPISVGAAHAAAANEDFGIDGGPARHSWESPTTRLAFLDDRIPVPAFRQVLSIGDVVLVLGLSWWLLSALGSRLVPARPPGPAVAAAGSMVGQRELGREVKYEEDPARDHLEEFRPRCLQCDHSAHRRRSRQLLALDAVSAGGRVLHVHPPQS